LDELAITLRPQMKENIGDGYANINTLVQQKTFASGLLAA